MLVWLAAISLSLAGLSQIYKTDLWLDYYARLLARGPTAVRGHGAVVAFIGVLIVWFHNVWEGPVVILTAFGWLLLLEGAVSLISPGVTLRTMIGIDASVRRKAMVATGVSVLIVAGVLWAALLTR